MGVGGREGRTISFSFLTLVGNNEWKEFNPMKVMKLNPRNVSLLPSSKNYFNASYSHHALPPQLKILQIDYFRMHTNTAVTLSWKPFY